MPKLTLSDREKARHVQDSTKEDRDLHYPVEKPIEEPTSQSEDPLKDLVVEVYSHNAVTTATLTQNGIDTINKALEGKLLGPPVRL